MREGITSIKTGTYFLQGKLGRWGWRGAALMSELGAVCVPTTWPAKDWSVSCGPSECCGKTQRQIEEGGLLGEDPEPCKALGCMKEKR